MGWLERVLVLISVLVIVPAEARELRFGLLTPQQHIWTQAAYRFGDALQEETGDRLKVAVFPAGQLGDEAQLLRLLQTGALDLAILTVSEISNRAVDFGAFYAPYLVPDLETADRLLMGKTATGLLDTLPERLGIFGVGYTFAGMRQIMSRAAVNDPAALAGRKIRITPLAPIRDFYLMLGMAPTPMPLVSVYDALANGQIDAIDMDLEMAVKLRYYHYTATALMTNHMIFPAIGVVSGRTWLRLDDADREILTRLLAERLQETRQAFITSEAVWLEDLKATGIDVRQVGPEFFGDTLDGWYSRWHALTPILDHLVKEARELASDTTEQQ